MGSPNEINMPSSDEVFKSKNCIFIVFMLTFQI